MILLKRYAIDNKFDFDSIDAVDGLLTLTYLIKLNQERLRLY